MKYLVSCVQKITADGYRYHMLLVLKVSGSEVCLLQLHNKQLHDSSLKFHVFMMAVHQYQQHWLACLLMCLHGKG